MNHVVHYVSVCRFRHPLYPPRSLHSREQCPNARSLSVSLSPFFVQCFIFSTLFFIGCAMYAVGGHLVLIWSPPRLLCHNWLLIRSRTPIRCREWCNHPYVLVTVLYVWCIMYSLRQVGRFAYSHVRPMSRLLSLQPYEPSAMLSTRWLNHSFSVACV